MESIDSVKPIDDVKVTIWGPDDSCLYESTNKGYHTIEEAIRTAIANANLGVSPEDCVFEVTNEDKGISHKYRFNAHGNLKLII